MQVDLEAPLRFLKAAFQPHDWIAVLLKRHDTGEVVQRVGPLDMALAPRFQNWLRFKNAQGFSVFVSVNALTPGQRSRTRDFVSAVRHVFLDADRDCDRVLATIDRRPDLPAPSFVIRSSAGMAHVLWRVRGMAVDHAEALQKHLARALGTDIAATSAAQLTRLPGFFNRKYAASHLVTAQSHDETLAYRTTCFPQPLEPSVSIAPPAQRPSSLPIVELARRYVSASPPAVEGQRGDLRTFTLCCRLIERFGLRDDEALTLLRGWNANNHPPWTTRELASKIRSARRHSRSP